MLEFLERIKVNPTPNVLNALLLREEKRLQWAYEGVSTDVLVSDIIRKAVPDHRVGYRERPTYMQTEPVARHHQ